MAQIYRYIISIEHVGTGTISQTTCHVQTDVPIAGTEPGAQYVLDQLDQHFSTSGTNLNHIRNAMASTLRVVKTQLREEVEPGSGDIPETAENTYGLSGLLSASAATLPLAVCVWYRFNTGVGIRSARGGTHGPPYMAHDSLNSSREIDFATGYGSANATLAAKFADHLNDNFQTTGDINFVIYSRVRRQRGQSPFTFKLTGTVATSKPRWLRRRETSP